MPEQSTNENSLNDLIEENLILRKKLSEYKDTEEDILSYKVFVNARKQMFAWLSLVGVALSVFGYASITSLLDKSKETVDVIINEKVENIAQEVALKAKKKLESVTDQQIASMLERQLEVRVNSLVEDRSKTLLAKVDEKLSAQDNKLNLIRDEVKSLRSERGDTPTSVRFVNDTPYVIDIYWKDYQGKEVKYNSLNPGESYEQSTYVSHPWLVKRKSDQKLLTSFTAKEGREVVNVE